MQELEDLQIHESEFDQELSELYSYDIDEFNNKLDGLVSTKNLKSGKGFNAIYENHSIKPKLTKSEFTSSITKASDFEDFYDKESVIEFLSQRQYDDRVVKQKNEQITIDTRTANLMFYTCYQTFKNKIDSVECFSVILDYYGFEPQYFFGKLVKTIRVQLIDDLRTRTGFKIDLTKTFEEGKYRQITRPNLWE